MTLLVSWLAITCVFFSPNCYTEDNKAEPEGDKINIKTVFIVPSCHWDVDFEKTFDEYKKKAFKNIAAAIDIISAKPEFRFTIENVIFLKYFWETHPEYREKLRRFVREGKFEIAGGMWTQPDENLVSAESLVRNMLLGNEWLRQNNIPASESKTICQIDTFGHPAAMPHLLKQAGYKYCCFARIELNKQYILSSYPSDWYWFVLKMFDMEKDNFEELHYGKNLPKSVDFWWQSPDGDRILTHWIRPTYNNLWQVTRDMDESFTKVRQAIEAQAPFSLTDNIMLFCSGDFSDPQRLFYLPEVVKEWNQRMLPATGYRLVIATIGDYFQSLEKDSKNLPVYGTEFNPALGTSCYINRPEIKQINHQLETKLFSAERFGAIASLIDIPYPRSELNTIWELLCTGHHHDIITGTSAPEPARSSFRRYIKADSLIKPLQDMLMEQISSKIDTRPPGELSGVRPVIVFNPVSWERTDIAELEVALKNNHSRSIIIYNFQGTKIPSQVLSLTNSPNSENKKAKIIFLAEDVPSLGYKTFWFKESEEPPSDTPAPVSISETTMENHYYRLRLDPKKGGGVVSLMDKEQNRELIDPSGELKYSPEGFPEKLLMIFAPKKVAKTKIVGNDLIVSGDMDSRFGVWVSFRDYPPQYATYLIAKSSEAPGARLNVTEHGPIRSTIRVTHELLNTVYIRDITLYTKLKRIDFTTKIPCFRETGAYAVEIAFPFNLTRGTPYYEIPYGIVPLIDYRYNKAVHTYMVLTDGNKNMVIINQAIPCCHFEENSMSLILLKQQSENPILKMMDGLGWLHEFGKGFKFCYSLTSNAGNWDNPRVRQSAQEVNAPLIPVLASVHKGHLPSALSFVWLDNPELEISTIKLAEVSASIIIRIFNPTGHKIKGKLFLNPAVFDLRTTWELADLREKGLKKTLKGNPLEITLPGFGITTLKVSAR